MLASRYAAIFMGKMSASDQRTVLGRTLLYLLISCGLDPLLLEQTSLIPGLIKKKLVYSVIPEDDEWRTGMCCELLKLRENKQVELQGFTQEETIEMLRYVCVS
jgi:hypothetical protein